MKREDSALRLGFTYAGCFLGAGYVSGQELWQFFGSFGWQGAGGLLLAILLFYGFGVLLLRLIQKTGIDQSDALVVTGEHPFLKALTGFLQFFFLFGIFVIMAAGVGALAEQVLGVPPAVGSAVFCTVVMLLSLRGTGGMMSVFSAVVPLLVICSVLISVIAVIRSGEDFGAFSAMASGGNPLLKNWAFSAFVYVSYNLFASIGILAPVGVLIPSAKTVWRGIAVGCFLLLMIAAGIFLALGTAPAAALAELPMLVIAESVGQGWYLLYALLLLGGMFGTSLSCMVASQHYFYHHFPGTALHRPRTAILTGTAAWLGSLAGFGSLVGTVYPLCGYCGAFALAGLLWHTISLRRKG